MIIVDSANNEVPMIANRSFSITPDDSAQLAQNAFIMVGASGNVKLELQGDSSPVTIFCVAGVIYPLLVKKVYATDTVATGIVGFYSKNLNA